MNIAGRALWATGLAVLMACPARAQSPSAPADVRPLFDPFRASGTAGPAEIRLAGKGALKLPAGYGFVPQPQASQLMRAVGNPVNDLTLLGLVLPPPGQGWLITVRHDDPGHVGDEEARDWNADDMMQAFRDAAAATNAGRAGLGAPPIEIEGWAEKPAYDAVTHRLVWATTVRAQGAAAGQAQIVNYNIYLLGRDGYYALNLVTPLQDLAASRPAAQALLAALDFDQGQRYRDFNDKTDRTAPHGLGALVVGATGGKAALGGVAGLLLVDHGKATVVALVALCVAGVLLSRRGLRSRRPPAPQAPPVA